MLCRQMSVIFSESGLRDVQPPCVVQTFVNHNARLFKIFIVGRRRFIIQRPSIKNLYAGGIFAGRSHWASNVMYVLAMPIIYCA